MIYVTDFDYTLFDTSRLLEKMVSEFERFGIKREDYFSAYAASKKANGYYDYKDHLGRLAFGQDYEAALEVVDAVLTTESPQCLYPDALLFLKRVRDAGHMSFLLTFGQDDWQRKKVVSAQIDGFLQVQTTVGSKTAAFEALAQHNQPITLIEDSGPNIDQIKTAYPAVTAVWVRRPTGKYRDEPCALADHEVTDLSHLPFASPSV